MERELQHYYSLFEKHTFRTMQSRKWIHCTILFFVGLLWWFRAATCRTCCRPEHSPNFLHKHDRLHAVNLCWCLGDMLPAQRPPNVGVANTHSMPCTALYCMQNSLNTDMGGLGLRFLIWLVCRIREPNFCTRFGACMHYWTFIMWKIGGPKKVKEVNREAGNKRQKTTETCLERTQNISRQDQQGSWNKCETSTERIQKTSRRKKKTHV